MGLWFFLHKGRESDNSAQEDTANPASSANSLHSRAVWKQGTPPTSKCMIVDSASGCLFLSILSASAQLTMCAAFLTLCALETPYPPAETRPAITCAEECSHNWSHISTQGRSGLTVLNRKSVLVDPHMRRSKNTSLSVLNPWDKLKQGGMFSAIRLQEVSDELRSAGNCGSPFHTTASGLSDALTLHHHDSTQWFCHDGSGCVRGWKALLPQQCVLRDPVRHACDVNIVEESKQPLIAGQPRLGLCERLVSGLSEKQGHQGGRLVHPLSLPPPPSPHPPPLCDVLCHPELTFP